jgi:hypothetical protein
MPLDNNARTLGRSLVEADGDRLTRDLDRVLDFRNPVIERLSDLILPAFVRAILDRRDELVEGIADGLRAAGYRVEPPA